MRREAGVNGECLCLRFEISEQSLEYHLVRVVFLPLVEVSYAARPVKGRHSCSSGVLRHYVIDPNREEHGTLFSIALAPSGTSRLLNFAL